MRLRVNKIASVTRRLELPAELNLSNAPLAEEGAVIACRVLNDKNSYNTLEDVHGRMIPLHSGDIIVGALGRRQALHGYAGVIPAAVAPGDELNLLNLGGVLGCCTSQNPDVGPPFCLEVLGQVLRFPDFQSRRGVPANIMQLAASTGQSLPGCPVVMICGSCMNSGKTVAASSLVGRFAQRGLKVGGGKLTGVALLRDSLMLRDYGAACAFDFVDAGLPSTSSGNSVAATRCVLALLAAQDCDVIVLEMGDGIFGQYGVQQILGDTELRGLISALVYCSNDPAGAFGGALELEQRYGLRPVVVSGPVTDNMAGERFVRDELGLVAINARNEPDELATLLQDALGLAVSKPAGWREAVHAG